VEPRRPTISSSRAPSNTGGGDVGVRLGSVGVDRDEALLPVARSVLPLDLPALLGQPAQVDLQDLADVHPARHAERVEHDVDGGAVLHERHVLDRAGSWR
jgi:hypothetical protein